mmetsp:Transcript_8602/g.15915  ORF Transcript_8602/g.15915 Transcript_8602/m.15915 type:complete len:412 (+) Transcript_8602:260-1495(+)
MTMTMMMMKSRMFVVAASLLALSMAASVAMAQQQERTAEQCANDLDVLRNAIVVNTPKKEELQLECNMTYNPCEPGTEFRYRNPEERIANFGPVEITCGTRQLLECDANGCLTQITLADLGLQVNGTMDLMAPFPSLKVLDIDGYCEFGASVGGICVSEFNGTIAPFVDGVNKDLEYFSMRGTYLEGDTTSLSALKKLTHLDLFGNMELTGNLNEALGGAPGMEYLNLMSTCTQVDLKTVGSLEDLIFLNLHAWGAQPPRMGCPIVEGKLKEIKNLKKLQYLDITNWESEGKLKDLSKMKELVTLYVANFDGSLQVSGDLSDLKDLSELETLSLNKLNVTMSYEDLKYFPQLTSLNVFEAGVTGDATVVCSMDKLNKLQLVGSGASCEELVVMDDALGYTVPCLDTCSIIS